MTWSLIILLFFTCNKNILRKLGITTKDAICDKTNNKNQPLFFYCLFYRVVRFEDLALNPFESTLKIFRSLKLPITSNLELYIQKHTKAKNTKNLVSCFQFLYLSRLFYLFSFYSTPQPLWEIQDKLSMDGQQKWSLTREKQLRILVKQPWIFGGTLG